jgi:hypothetical protein
MTAFVDRRVSAARIASASRRLLLSAFCFAIGCGTVEGGPLEGGALNRVALRASHPRTIVLAKAPCPSFANMTTSPLGGMVGAAREAQLVPFGQPWPKGKMPVMSDPAIKMGGDLAAALARKYALQIVTRAESDASGAPADLRLEVTTSAWGYARVHDWRFIISYEGTIKLIDERRHVLLAEGSCSYRPLESEDDPTYEALVANDGALVKAKVASMAESCLDDYRMRILGIYQ